MNVNLCMGCMQPMEEGKYCAHCGFCEEEYTRLPHQLPLRTILNGKYMIGKVLGEGGFGITYLGWDLNLEMKVAIKEYYPREIVTRMSDVSLSVSVLSGGVRQPYEEGVERFMNEAKRLARLSHLPGIVMVKDFFQENRTAYIVMEYIDGNSMKDMLRERNGRISMEETMAMILPVMDSLEKVHEVGIIHRDISPNNLMFNQYGQVKLIDFGAARYVMAANRTGMDRKSLSVIFTPGYAPVEQYSSKGNQGPWTDVYAICATIFRAITGIVPEESLDRLNGVEQPSPSMLGVKDITPSQEAALMKGLVLQPQDRYRTITELKEALLYNMDEDDQEDKQEDDNLKVNQDNKTEIDNSEKTHENDKEKEDLKAPKERDLWEQDIPVFDKIILNPGNEKQESGIIGIDFEERYTFITVMRNGTFISVKENGDMIPSVCTITRLGECLFGNRAVRYGKVHNESVLKLTKYCGNKAEISRHGFTFSAQYICTEFFRYLKELAESELKLRIDGALLTLGNVDMIYRWRIAQAAGNAGIKIKRIICKPLACALVNYIYEPLAEENVIVCSFDGSFISGVCLEVGDGVIEVLSREEMHMQKYKENLSGKIIELIQKLIHEGCMEANDIDRVMIFSNEPVPQNVIIDQAFQGKEKRVTLDTLFDQPVRGAAIDGGLLHGDRHCEGILLLDVCSHPIDIIVWRENDVEPETISFMKSNTTLPTKVIREIKVKSGESLDIYVLYREKDHIHIRNSLAKVHLDGTWIEGTTQVNVTLDVYSGERIDLEIENPNTNMKIKKHVYGFEYENKEDSDDITIEGVIKKVLSVGEGIEWGLRNLSEEERETPTGKGLIQVYKKWKDVMRELHITPIRAEGMYFDIQYHTAIMYVTDENLDANMIVEELQTGYMYHGKVIKPSFVKVAN